jgi:peptidoglycan-associated lipoprotein
MSDEPLELVRIQINMNYSIIAKLFVVALIVSGCSSASRYVKRGNKKFNRGEYAYAIEHYQRALGKGADPSFVNTRIAESYRLSNKLHDAAPFYGRAIKANPQADSIHFYYGLALKAEGKYQLAAQQLAEYAETGNDMELVERAKEEIKSLEQVREILQKDAEYVVENFESLNTPSADFSPVLLNQEMIFSSSRGEGKVYAATGSGFTNLYRYKFDGITPTSGAVMNLEGKINNPNINEATATISRDGKTMIFARGNSGSKKGAKDVDLYITYFRNGQWTEPELLKISDPDAWDSSPAFSADGKSLYFSSNRKGGQGGNDIYRATKDANGRWTKVVNMGDEINTKGNEVFPYVTDDGKLYFSSDGHPSLGGLDLFEGTREKGVITIVNLGSPMNTRWDDFGITFKSPVDGFFSSNRDGGKGDDDIYWFKNIKSTLKSIDFVVNGVVIEQSDSGQVILPNARVRLVENNSGKVVGETQATEEGKFSFPLQSNRNYTFIAEKPSYFTKREGFTTYGKSIPQEQLKTDTTIALEHTIALNKIEVERTIVIDNIYYDFNKADIREDASEELDKIVQLLEDNPNIAIELGSHTDSRGKDDFNLKLSQRRAESAVAYIVSKGIEPERITARGYGETTPLIEEATTEEEHQRNRRTEFKVTRVQ